MYPQPVQLVEGIRGVLALKKTTESMLTDFKNQDFSLSDEEINHLRQTVKGKIQGSSQRELIEINPCEFLGISVLSVLLI